MGEMEDELGTLNPLSRKSFSNRSNSIESAVQNIRNSPKLSSRSSRSPAGKSSELKILFRISERTDPTANFPRFFQIRVFRQSSDTRGRPSAESRSVFALSRSSNNGIAAEIGAVRTSPQVGTSAAFVQVAFEQAQIATHFVADLTFCSSVEF